MNTELQAQAMVMRYFNASPERVFGAWLDPELIGQWMFGSDGREEEVVKITVDARVGGGFSFVVRRQGQEIDHLGEYFEIVRPCRLVFSWGIRQGSPGNSRVIVEIVPLDRGAELTLTHELQRTWGDCASRAEGAWARMLDTLAATLSRNSPGLAPE